ncbi:MAG: hypothetical protein ABSD02_23855 [Steroidobacteraceae bacterium]|jgi:hypothetical protein
MFVSFAIFSPILMVIVAGMLPEGTRGTMIVTGHTLLVAILALALVMRVVYRRSAHALLVYCGRRIRYYWRNAVSGRPDLMGRRGEPLGGLNATMDCGNKSGAPRVL